MLQRTLIASLACTAATLAASADTDYLQVGRYTSVAATPDARTADPLEAVVTLHFAHSAVRTVGDALAYFLPRAGYRLSQASLDDPALAELLRQALPESQRALGPCSVRTAVQTLVGRAFALQDDPARRRLTVLPVPAAAATASDPAGERP